MRSFVEYKTTKATLKIDEPDPIFDEYIESEDMWQALYNEEAAYESLENNHKKWIVETGGDETKLKQKRYQNQKHLPLIK